MKWIVIFRLNGKVQQTQPFGSEQDAQGAVEEIIEQDGISREEIIVKRVG